MCRSDLFPPRNPALLLRFYDRAWRVSFHWLNIRDSSDHAIGMARFATFRHLIVLVSAGARSIISSAASSQTSLSSICTALTRDHGPSLWVSNNSRCLHGWIADLATRHGRPERRPDCRATRLVKDCCNRIVAGHRHSTTVTTNGSIRVVVDHLVPAVIGPSPEVRPLGG
jgi:hypothetical protein